MRITFNRARLATVAGFSGAAAAVLLTSGAPHAQRSTHSLDLRVEETAGIRRTTYPAGTRIHLDRGVLSDPAHARLLSNGKEVAAQFGAESAYPDGSVQWLTVDFNASIGPRESDIYQLEYGGDVKTEVAARGLSVAQDAGGIQVGNARFKATGAPLLLSVKYRQEVIGQGPNGFALIDTGGIAHDASTAENVKMEIVKRGPLLAALRYTGDVRLAKDYAVGYATTVEMPNSKSWMKVTTAIADAGRRVRELSFHTPLALGAQPWTWDYGTGSWSYGVLRTATDSVTLSQFVGTQQATKWEIRTGAKGQEQSYEMSGGRRPSVAEGWGHVQDPKEAIAFAVPDFGAEAGNYSITIDGDGQLSYRFAPARPLPHLQLTVYQHFVSTPVQIGAATSPVAMLNPLVVSFSAPR